MHYMTLGLPAYFSTGFYAVTCMNEASFFCRAQYMLW